MSKHLPRTLVESVLRKVAERPGAICFQAEDDSGRRPVTHEAYHRDICALARAMRGFGVEKGDRVAILARPSYEWEVCDKAIMLIGGISTGLDHKSTRDGLAHTLAIAEPVGLFVESASLCAQLPAAALDGLRFVCVLDGSRPDDRANAHDLAELLREHDDGTDVPCLAGPDDVGAIIFTSGTTGSPKGIPLRHHQMAAILQPMQEIFPDESGHRTIAWIPLHNSTGRFMGSGNYFMDVVQYPLRDPYALLEQAKIVNPTYLVVMPRVLEKVYAGLQQRLAERPAYMRAAVRALLGWRSSFKAGWVDALTDRMLIAKIRRAVWGDSIEFLISGSAPVDAQILRFFDSMGVPTYEVYAISEVGSLLTMNRPGRMRYGSVGEPMQGMALKIAPDGEVVVKTTAALECYWGGDRTDLYDEDGYFRTGDLGELRDGYVYLTGRKKEIIKTSTGQRIAPVEVEQVYRSTPGLDQLMVIGNGRSYLTALVTLEPEFARKLEAEGRRADDHVGECFERCCRALPANRQIKRFTVLPEPFSVEGGEITATLKLRRRVVEEKYASVIEAMYAKP
ncbi:MAG: AMP-binding protein [Ectothiorhodospiraceae bacterium]|nr:AMP-binding protein [Ectothiorhodospiraceae bacterium]